MGDAGGSEAGSAAYQKGIREHLPNAQIVFDRFHVMQLAGKALDEVRKQLQHEGAEMKGALWALRGNASCLRLCFASRFRPSTPHPPPK